MARVCGLILIAARSAQVRTPQNSAVALLGRRRQSPPAHPRHLMQSDTLCDSQRAVEMTVEVKIRTGIVVGRSGLASSFLPSDWKSVRPGDRTSVRVHVLRDLLIESHYDLSLTNYLFNGFSFGFKLGLDQPVSHIVEAIANNSTKFRGNHKSALSNPKAMEAKLTKELESGRLLGPFR
jgi:hypothetical protein